MTYKILVEEYFYRPTPEEAGPEFDPVVWKTVEEKETESLAEVLNVLSAFNAKWDSVTIQDTAEGYFCLKSNSDSEHEDNPEHYYTVRHCVTITWEK